MSSGNGKWTPERREAARERARRLVDEGRLGGKQPGAGRPRKKRASEKVAEEAAANAKQIVSAFSDALDESNLPSVRLNAAQAWLKVEQEETKLQMEEERHVDQLQTNQLIELITKKLSRLQQEEVLGDIISEETIDIIEEGPQGLTQGHDSSGEETWTGWTEE